MAGIGSANKEENMADEKTYPKLIGNKSDGYKYKYTSLGDLVLNEVPIPPMRVATLTDGNGNPVLDRNGNPIEYIEAERTRYTDNGTKLDTEWIRGARVVVPSSTQMNEAQAYGSALTYARRYTVLTILGIATDDDKKLETTTEAEQKANEDNAKQELRELYEKAGGADFEKWFTDSTKKGFDTKAYMAMKTTLLKQINKKAEESK